MAILPKPSRLSVKSCYLLVSKFRALEARGEAKDSRSIVLPNFRVEIMPHPEVRWPGGDPFGSGDHATDTG